MGLITAKYCKVLAIMMFVVISIMMHPHREDLPSLEFIVPEQVFN